MRVKCDFCKTMVDDKFVNCPNCGAPLNVSRWANDVPKTIEELKEWYEAHNLPDEKITRFFIGKDVREAKSFGIYRNGAGDFVVYKITSDGSRKVRYEGSDEEYAVNEIYQKLRAEISNQKEHSKDYGKIRPKSYNENEKDSKESQNDKEVDGVNFILDSIKSFFKFLDRIDWKSILSLICCLFIVVLIIIGVYKCAVFTYYGFKSFFTEQQEYLNSRPPEGYYTYNDTEYCYYGNSWFKYNEGLDDWDIEYSAPIDDVINNENYTEFAIPYEVYSAYGPEGHAAFDFNIWSDKHSSFRSSNRSNNRNSYSYDSDDDDFWSNYNNNSWSYSYDDDNDDDVWGGYSNSYSYDSDDGDSWNSYNNNSWSYSYDNDDDSWFSDDDSWFDSDDDWSDWDSDSNWDSGYDSWDSGYTDWGSDW